MGVREKKLADMLFWYEKLESNISRAPIIWLFYDFWRHETLLRNTCL